MKKLEGSHNGVVSKPVSVSKQKEDVGLGLGFGEEDGE